MRVDNFGISFERKYYLPIYINGDKLHAFTTMVVRIFWVVVKVFEVVVRVVWFSSEYFGRRAENSLVVRVFSSSLKIFIWSSKYFPVISKFEGIGNPH